MDFYFSAENGDRGEVRLNGSIVEHVIACNTKHGWVECAVQPLTYSGGTLIKKVLNGDVTFTRFAGYDSDE